MEMDLASLYEHMHDALDGMYYSYSEHEYHLQKVNSTHNDLVHEAVFTFDKNLAFITWQNLAVLENVEATLPEVITILDGCRAKSVSPFDSKKILSYGQACQILMQLLKEGRFNLDKQILCAIHHYCAQADLKTDDRGAFRRENVIISGTSYVPPKYEDLADIFKEGIDFINMHVDNPVEKALLAFLFCCRSQFFKDGNKRTASIFLNGILLSHGFAPIAILKDFKQEMVKLLVEFYEIGNADHIIDFFNKNFDEQFKDRSEEAKQKSDRAFADFLK